MISYLVWLCFVLNRTDQETEICLFDSVGLRNWSPKPAAPPRFAVSAGAAVLPPRASAHAIGLNGARRIVHGPRDWHIVKCAIASR